MTEAARNRFPSARMANCPKINRRIAGMDLAGPVQSGKMALPRGIEPLFSP